MMLLHNVEITSLSRLGILTFVCQPLFDHRALQSGRILYPGPYFKGHHPAVQADIARSLFWLFSIAAQILLHMKVIMDMLTCGWLYNFWTALGNADCTCLSNRSAVGRLIGGVGHAGPVLGCCPSNQQVTMHSWSNKTSPSRSATWKFWLLPRMKFVINQLKLTNTWAHP